VFSFSKTIAALFIVCYLFIVAFSCICFVAFFFLCDSHFAWFLLFLHPQQARTRYSVKMGQMLNCANVEVMEETETETSSSGKQVPSDGEEDGISPSDPEFVKPSSARQVPITEDSIGTAPRSPNATLNTDLIPDSAVKNRTMSLIQKLESQIQNKNPQSQQQQLTKSETVNPSRPQSQPSFSPLTTSSPPVFAGAPKPNHSSAPPMPLNPSPEASSSSQSILDSVPSNEDGKFYVGG
jgi:hypothetical protein